MKPVARKYEEYLIEKGVVTKERVDQMKAEIRKTLEDEYVASKSN
jgi:TPP-dependent pyruvate/acetoin dehydrogenase alpha subunit